MEFPRRIALSEVKEMLARDLPVLFIDARQEKDWKQTDLKLPGALRISPDDIEAHIAEVPRDDITIVTYCACPNEGSSAAVAQKLIDHGFQRVYPLSGGYARWLEDDSPMQRKNEKQKQRVPSQPNLVITKDIAEQAAGGKGPVGENRKGRD